MRALLLTTACAATMAAAPPASAATGTQIVFGVTGYVPLKCSVDLEAQSVQMQGGLVSLGRLVESCNNSRGYEVYAEVSPGLAGAKLIVDGRSVPLTEASATLVSMSSGPGQKSHEVSLDGPKGVGGTISFRVMPR